MTCLEKRAKHFSKEGKINANKVDTSKVNLSGKILLIDFSYYFENKVGTI